MKIEQRIVCAAIMNRNTLEIIAGVRHFDKIMCSQMDCHNPIWYNPEQGFLDNKGNFLSRVEAYKVAEAADQIIRDCGNNKRLFSEHLY